VKFNYGPRAKEKKAYALKSLERYTEATELFYELINEGSQIAEYRKEVAICRLASDWLNSPDKKYEIDNWKFNTRSSDYSPVFLDDHRVVFSSDRSNKTSEEKYNWTGRDYSDIYIYNATTNDLSHLDPSINTANNEGTACFNEDGSVLYFTRCVANEAYDEYCKLMVSSYIDGNWTKPEVLSFIMDEVNYGHPYWNEKDSVLFFSAEIQKESKGGFDLYFASLDKFGAWSAPKNLGSTINTIGDEKFPSLKGDTLYFASSGHPGMGGLDIFYSYIENGTWIRPFNMKSPINSGADDFGISFNPNPDIPLNGLFTSSRDGIDNIYEFELSEKPIKPDPTEDDDEEKEKDLKLAITVLAEQENGEKIPFPSANMSVNGEVKKLNSKSFSIMDIDAGAFEIVINSPGYFNQKKNVSVSYDDIPDGKTSYTYNTTVILKPIIENKEIVLENIFYDFNKYNIREDAKPSLIELTSLLTENPEISIELSSHTDCRGPNGYNEKLSQQRAQSAVDYIINLGILASRITAKGYGENQPVADCACDNCTEEQHQLNRRTSFRITKIGQ
jgi:outer membrane protein OmpA-like peptidoglycan-associated protein